MRTNSPEIQNPARIPTRITSKTIGDKVCFGKEYHLVLKEDYPHSSSIELAINQVACKSLIIAVVDVHFDDRDAGKVESLLHDCLKFG